MSSTLTTIDNAAQNEVFMHRGRLVYWADAGLTDVAAYMSLTDDMGAEYRVEAVLRDGRCVLTNEDGDEETRSVIGWTAA